MKKIELEKLLFPPNAGWKHGEGGLCCHHNTQGRLVSATQVEGMAKDVADLLGVVCEHCALVVHWGCLEKGWDLRCDCVECARKKREMMKKQPGLLDDSLYYPVCLGCRLPPRETLEGFEAPVDPLDCCTYCLQCVKKPAGPSDVVVNARTRRLLLYGGVKEEAPYRHAICRDVQEFAYPDDEFVVRTKNEAQMRRAARKPDWGFCQGPRCEKPDKQNGRIIKCTIKGCLYALHPSCIDSAERANLVTSFHHDVASSDDEKTNDAAERPSGPARLLPRGSRLMKSGDVVVELYCPEHTPATLFDEDDTLDMMAAYRVINLPCYMPQVVVKPRVMGPPPPPRLVKKTVALPKGDSALVRSLIDGEAEEGSSDEGSGDEDSQSSERARKQKTRNERNKAEEMEEEGNEYDEDDLNDSPDLVAF